MKKLLKVPAQYKQSRSNKLI